MIKNFFKKISSVDLIKETEIYLSKIDKIELKTFFILFTTMFLLYSVLTYPMFWGNHDWDLMFSEICKQEGLYIGRYSIVWPELLFIKNYHVYFLVNLFAYSFLPLFVIYSLKFFKVPKNLFVYTLIGLFFCTSPFIYFIFYYRISTLEYALLPFLTLISIQLTSKINSRNSVIKNIILFFSSLVLLGIFVLGAYQPIITMVIMFAFFKLLSDFTENKFKNFITVIKNNIFIFVVIFLAVIINFVIYKFIDIYMPNTLAKNFYNFQLIEVKNLFPEIISYFKNFIPLYIFTSYPYISFSYRILLFIFYILGIFTSVKYYLKSNSDKKNLFVLLFILFILLFSSEITYLVSTFKNPILRLESFNSLQLYFLSLILIFKCGQNFEKNIAYFLLIPVIYTSIIAVLSVEQTFSMIKSAEENIQQQILTRIINDNNFDKDKTYHYIQLGHYKQLGPKLYKSNKYSQDSTELFYNIIHEFDPNVYIYRFGYLSGLINLLHTTDNDSYNMQKISQKLDKDINDWILTKADVFPNPTSVFIHNDKIILVMDKDALEQYKKYINSINN